MMNEHDLPFEPDDGTWPPEGMTTRVGADGGTWIIPAAPDDALVMQPIVEDAMNRIGDQR